MNNGLKKVNLLPKSVSQMKTWGIIQVITIVFCLLTILGTLGFWGFEAIALSNLETQISEQQSTINSADFERRNELENRYNALLAASDSGNFNTIPVIYEDMTDFLSCIVENMPKSMKLENISGNFTAEGVYSYTFAFKCTERNSIPNFLKALQKEETLKYVNISAITSEGSTNVNSNNSQDVVDQSTTQNSDGTWKFTLVIKSKGGER